MPFQELSYEEIQTMRKKIGVTVTAFCEVLGVSKSTYYSWSQPGRQPKGSTLRLLNFMIVNPERAYWDLKLGVIE